MIIFRLGYSIHTNSEYFRCPGADLYRSNSRIMTKVANGHENSFGLNSGYINYAETLMFHSGVAYLVKDVT